MRKYILIVILLLFDDVLFAQNTFLYDIQLTPISIPNLPGLHSYAFGQHDGKWLVIGGRKDGLHARQPFASFPKSNNNTTIYVVDIATKKTWSASLNVLSTGLREQLQSTNMNFYQDENSLYIIGGYSFSKSVNDHITHNKLTAIDVPNLITAIIAKKTILPYFKQISNPIFQNTGGQLGKIGNEFYLVGGQIFTGRYNPMNGPSFVQTYVSKIQKFTINNSKNKLSFGNYSQINDAVHLHRRDYNLVPQIFPNGDEGYTISSGVFQINSDLPFLYPVDIKKDGYSEQTQFNQYLSNYHSGKVGIYDQKNNQMHSLFFGGISQYYFKNSEMVRDTTVPFVKTISRVTRLTDGSLSEHNFPVEMPNLKGAGAEFIPNKNIPHYSNEVIKWNEITSKEVVIGHLYGGIQSSSKSAFTDNQTSLTQADPTIYEVKLVYNPNIIVKNVDGSNMFEFSFLSDFAKENSVKIHFNLPYIAVLDYFITSNNGEILDDGEIGGLKTGENTMTFNLENAKEKEINITFVFDNKFYRTQKLIRN
jgi:hypothetical protein